MKLNNKSNKGFTIIEVLIVLTIASAILLVVFLAVPALQRNSRNTAYRQEAQRILGGVQEYVSNNGGTSISAASVCDETTGSTGCTSSSPSSGNLVANNIMILGGAKNYTQFTIEAHSTTAPAPTLTKAILRYAAKCDGQTATASGTGRQVALIFAIENSKGDPQAQCINS